MPGSPPETGDAAPVCVPPATAVASATSTTILTTLGSCPLTRRLKLRPRRALRPGQAAPARRAPSPEALDPRVRLPPVGGLFRHARAVARRELRHGVANAGAGPRAGH